MSGQAQFRLAKEHLDYEAILQLLGIPYIEDESDGTLLFRCLNPDHNDATPSMRLRYRYDGNEKAALGSWKCWNGACHRWRGDVFDLIRVMRRDAAGRPINLTEAMLFATGGAGVSTDRMITAMCDDDIRNMNFKPKEPLAMPVPQVMPAGALSLPDLGGTHRYLYETRVPAIDARWPIEEECMVATSGPYEGYMIIPLRWMNGTPFTFQAVAVESWAVELRKSKGFKNLGTKLYPHKCPINHVLYGCHRAMKNAHLAVGEGCFDAWRLWEADDLFGDHDFHGLGTMTNRLTEEAEEIFRWLQPSRITVVKDNKPKPGEVEDTAGVSLALQFIERLGSECPVHVADLPVGNDPDSCDPGVLYRTVMDAPDSVTWAIQRGKRLAGFEETPGPSLSDLGL